MKNKRKRLNSKEWAAVVFLVLTFFPYLCVPLGENTNLPLSTLAALSLAGLYRSFGTPLRKIYIIVTGSLVPVIFSGSILGLPPNFRGIISFVLVLAPIVGFYLVAKNVPELTTNVLRWLIFSSSTFAVIQKFVFLDNGTIPFLELYNAPGYADVASNSFVIVTYMKRPFGQFPEPSFMAGTLALATIALIFLASRLRSFGILDRMLILLVVFVEYLSQSGLVFVSVVAILLFWAYIEPIVWLKRSAVLLAPFIGLFVVSDIASRRLVDTNWSWVDRVSAITSGLQFLLSEPLLVFTGVGLGNTSSLYASNRIQVGEEAFHAAPDIYSVFGRFILCAGVIGLVLLVSQIFTPVWLALRNELPPALSIGLLLVWVLVGTLVITYDSAAWVWGFGLLFVGFLESSKSRASEGGVVIGENSSSHKLA